MSASQQRSPVILIVEDEPLIRLAAGEAFSKENWDVVEAHTVEAALGTVEARSV